MTYNFKIGLNALIYNNNRTINYTFYELLTIRRDTEYATKLSMTNGIRRFGISIQTGRYDIQAHNP